MKNLIIIIGLLILSFELKAHDPDQLSYHFMRLGEGANLEVHFTPASAFDLLKSTNDSINDSTVIRLSDYTQAFEKYFNQTISLEIGGNHMNLKLTEANLTQHDAVLYFDIPNFQGSFDRFELILTSFTEIYRNTQNHVTVSGTSLLKQFTLDAENQVFQHNYQSTRGKQHAGQWPLILFLSLLTIASLFIYFASNRQYSWFHTVSR